MNTPQKLQIAIRHSPETGRFNVSDIHIGPLLAGLTEEPARLARGGEEKDKIKIEIERTHESELLLGIAIAGGAAFGKGILEALGKRIGNWIADYVERHFKEDAVEMRSEAGQSIQIDGSNPAATRTECTALLQSAAERGDTVVILFP